MIRPPHHQAKAVLKQTPAGVCPRCASAQTREITLVVTGNVVAKVCDACRYTWDTVEWLRGARAL